MRKEFARTFDSLEGIFRFAGDFFASEKIDERHRYAVDFALEEIFTNMVKYNPDGKHDVSINLDKLGDRLRITLTDFDVEPFDVSKAEEPRIDVPLEERDVGGLGLHLTRKMMDDVDYEYVDRRSIITLTKMLE
jgi:anti-sigma regulatory factor (Ser/Thr protein kinase)